MRLGHNKFSDWSKEEFRQKMGNPMLQQVASTLNSGSYDEPAEGLIVGSLDWRDTPAIGPIKNQEQCGSCYSFSANVCLEAGHYF